MRKLIVTPADAVLAFQATKWLSWITWALNLPVNFRHDLKLLSNLDSFIHYVVSDQFKGSTIQSDLFIQCIVSMTNGNLVLWLHGGHSGERNIDCIKIVTRWIVSRNIEN